MKRFYFIFFAVFLFVCSCELNFDGLTKSKVIGKWNVTEFNSTGTWETVEDGDMYAEFKSDHTYNSKFYSNTYTGTWKIVGSDTVKCNVSGVYVTYTMLYLKNNDATFEVKEPGYKPYSVKAIKE